MSLEIEVRSSGPGPRANYLGSGRENSPWVRELLTILVRSMCDLWTRMEMDHKNRHRLLSDGVAIIIRKER